jgi:hypothetical protein
MKYNYTLLMTLLFSALFINKTVCMGPSLSGFPGVQFDKLAPTMYVGIGTIPGSNQPAPKSMMTTVGEGVAVSVITGALGYFGKMAIEKYLGADTTEKIKLIEAERAALALEIEKSRASLVQKFTDLEREYLSCKRKGEGCGDIEDAFIRVGGQSAMDIIRKNS